MAATPSTSTATGSGGTLRRSVGFYGLIMVSLGSIIGSGWLLGAYKAAVQAGPSSLISWILAALMLAVLALIHAELGSAYPVAGGTARFPAFAFGKLVGFVAGWTAWLQAVSIAPIEVEASLSYLDNVGWIKTNLNLLHGDGTLTGSGLGFATFLMMVFTLINILGVKLLAESNSITVLWKAAIPVLTVVVLIALTFHASNFSAGGGFAPAGAHGVFAALPAGVVFALQGFEQAIQLGGEAKDPQRDISRAVIAAMLIGASIYILLEIAFIGGLPPANLTHGWSAPIAKGDFGPYATLASGAGAAWLAVLLYIDAFVSPAGTGLVYLGTSSRLSYALAQAGELPRGLSKIKLRGIPLYSIILAFVVGEIAFLPFPSWQSLVNLVTSATAIMYAFAPVALTALRRVHPARPRPYRLPAPKLLAPIGFCSANLIIYWSGFDTTWKIFVGILIGLVIFAATRTYYGDKATNLDWRGSVWMWPWMIGTLVIGLLGRYDSGSNPKGGGELNLLPNWVDLIVVIGFSLAVYYWAVRLTIDERQVDAAIEADQAALAEMPALNLP
jgi:amino acid transporter